VRPFPAPDVEAMFSWDGSAYHANWSTKGLGAGLYRIFVQLADGTTHTADVCLTR